MPFLPSVEKLFVYINHFDDALSILAYIFLLIRILRLLCQPYSEFINFLIRFMFADGLCPQSFVNGSFTVAEKNPSLLKSLNLKINLSVNIEFFQGVPRLQSDPNL